ncbi:MAG: DUF3422 domain-containing protein [Burkholderiales bacterium]|nr:DUF3422 domain-containing protein [Burkholderiales bacterium]
MASSTSLPVNHPQRLALANEVHARPPASLVTPEHVSYLALLMDEGQREAEDRALAALGKLLNLALPAPDTGHLIVDAGSFRFKWERHTEFSSYVFFRPAVPTDGPDATALDAVPADWVADLPGKLIAAAHVTVRRPAPTEPNSMLEQRIFADAIVGAEISEGAGWVFTDFRVGGDGFLRFLLLDKSLSSRQAGRMVQRLVEIETYRTMALLGFPVAKSVAAFLNRAEEELAQLTQRMSRADPSQDTALLNDLTRLAAQVEQSLATSAYRFGASQAYYDLVRRRVAELREQRIPGIQTIEEFMERRLAPAMATCAAIARRQEELSARIARASQFLRTRVDIELAEQNQELLVQMNRRAKLQLRLQQTVESISIVAMTYYAAGLVGYIAKSAKSVGWAVNVDVAVGVSVPIILLVLVMGLRKMRKRLAD